ncbi:MAG: peptidoglycan DD-metalloendopeptidase family protein [Bacteroidia bacterium]|nr:peptidoglycan DD-metalloendopeptidase family protein [Bacteroidia bacterium]
MLKKVAVVCFFLSVLCTKKYSFAEPEPITSSYSEERILFLIDSILNLKNPPLWVIEDLQKIIQQKYDVVEDAIVKAKTLSTIIGNHNEDDFYLDCWNNKDLKTFPDSLVKLDTGTVLNFYERPFSMPFQGKLTSPYGYREGRYHKGIDINLNKGNPIKSAFSGIVRIARRYGGFGNVVIIRHQNGVETVYAHLSKIKVKPGDQVIAGQLIGLGGSTGHSSGPHLHFEIRYLGYPINPEQFISLEDFRLKYPEFILKKNKLGYIAFPIGASFYTVKKGDNLFVIAQKYGLSITQLKNLNGISKKSKLYLKIGQPIRVS